MLQQQLAVHRTIGKDSFPDFSYTAFVFLETFAESSSYAQSAAMSRVFTFGSVLPRTENGLGFADLLATHCWRP